MNIRSIMHTAAAAWALAPMAVAAVAFSSCDKGYEPPPINAEDTGEGEDPVNSGNSEDSENPENSGDTENPDDSNRHEPVAPAGKGTREAPWNVAALRALPDDEEDIWVEGYVTGFVAGMAFDSGVRFRVPTEKDKYEGRNLVISCTADCRRADESAPVVLWGPFQRSYSLTARPDLIGRRILVNGSTGMVYGVRGIADPATLLVMDE